MFRMFAIGAAVAALIAMPASSQNSGRTVVVPSSPGSQPSIAVPLPPANQPGTPLAVAPPATVTHPAYVPVHSRARSYSGVNAYQPLDFQRGIWGFQVLTPPNGMVLSEQSELVGRGVKDASNTGYGTIDEVLLDPVTGEVHYAVISSPDLGTLNRVAVPITAMQIDSGSIVVDAPASQIELLPRYTVGDLQQRYPVTTARPTAPGGTAAVVPTGADLIGRTVIDSTGQAVGTVDSVLYEPNSQRLQYLVVAGQPFGADNFVAVPAANARLVQGRVQVNYTVQSLLSEPRYPRAALEQRFRAN